MKPLIEHGKVFIALPPLYKVSKGSGKKEIIEYAWSDEEMDDVLKKSEEDIRFSAIKVSANER